MRRVDRWGRITTLCRVCKRNKAIGLDGLCNKCRENLRDNKKLTELMK